MANSERRPEGGLGGAMGVGWASTAFERQRVLGIALPFKEQTRRSWNCLFLMGFRVEVGGVKRLNAGGFAMCHVNFLWVSIRMLLREAARWGGAKGARVQEFARATLHP